MRPVLLAAAILAGPAAAQEVRFSPAATDACVAQAAAPEAKRSCLGLSAQQCMGETSGGSTTIGMMDCLDQERDYWDARLNAAYKILRAKAKASDADLAEWGSSAPGTEPALKQMQRAWITYRDTTCEFERAQWGGGSGGGPAVLSCLMRLTGEQALYLESAWLGE